MNSIYVFGILLASIIVISAILSFIMYRKIFGMRFESYLPLVFRVEDFPGLKRTRFQFPSHQGHRLTGYLYDYDANVEMNAETKPRGILVLAHGLGGGGHNSYMDVINYFARHGYLVFAYDATGNDESEGRGVRGLPQGVDDLATAINYVKESGHFPKLPIVLFGHSWGGYSICNVLNYQHKIKAVVACSAFNSPSEMFKFHGKKMVKAFVYLFIPFLLFYEWIYCGKYSRKTAIDGLANSGTAAFIVHSADDTTVPIEHGYNVFYDQLQDDKRFRWLRLENRGHAYVYCDSQYAEQLDEQIAQWWETLAYDYRNKNNKSRFESEKADFIARVLDRKQWANMLDQELFAEFLEFYDKHLY